MYFQIARRILHLKKLFRLTLLQEVVVVGGGGGGGVRSSLSGPDLKFLASNFYIKKLRMITLCHFQFIAVASQNKRQQVYTR